MKTRLLGVAAGALLLAASLFSPVVEAKGSFTPGGLCMEYYYSEYVGEHFEGDHPSNAAFWLLSHVWTKCDEKGSWR